VPEASKFTLVIVCMLDNIHSSRWLEQFSEQEIDFLLFPSSPNRRVHSQLKALREDTTTANHKIVRLGKWFGLPLWVLDKFTNTFFREARLRWTIRRHQSDILRALELQNAGCLSLRALSKLKPEGLLHFIATNWRSDIFWFQRFPKHRAKLQALLKLADSYSTDCHWDLAPARELGFIGEVLAVIPNAVVNGTGLNIPARAKFLISHEQMLKLFAKSKIHVALSESDGISTSMLEAMAMGAITVQTSTACCDERVKDSAVAVREISVQAIKTEIREGQAVAEDPANAKENRMTWS